MSYSDTADILFNSQLVDALNIGSILNKYYDTMDGWNNNFEHDLPSDTIILLELENGKIGLIYSDNDHNREKLFSLGITRDEYQLMPSSRILTLIVTQETGIISLYDRSGKETMRFIDYRDRMEDDCKIEYSDGNEENVLEYVIFDPDMMTGREVRWFMKVIKKERCPIGKPKIGGRKQKKKYTKTKKYLKKPKSKKRRNNTKTKKYLKK